MLLGFVQYLLSDLSASLFALNEGSIIIDKYSILFILEKKTLYKRGVMSGSLIGYLYDKLKALNLGINFKIDIKLVNEQLYLKIEIKNKKSINTEALTGLLRIKGIFSNTDKFKNWFIRALGIYNFNSTTNTFQYCKDLIHSDFTNLEVIGNEIYKRC